MLAGPVTALIVRVDEPGPEIVEGEKETAQGHEVAKLRLKSTVDPELPSMLMVYVAAIVDVTVLEDGVTDIEKVGKTVSVADPER